MNNLKMVEKVLTCKRCGCFSTYKTYEDSYPRELCDSCENVMPVNYDSKEKMGGTLKSEIKEKFESMLFEDKINICEGCGDPFVTPAKAQEFDARYGIFDRPQLCPECFSNLELFRMEIDDFSYDHSDEQIQAYIERNMPKGIIPWLNIDLNEFIKSQIENAFEMPSTSYSTSRRQMERYGEGNEICAFCGKEYLALSMERTTIYNFPNHGLKFKCPECREKGLK